MVGYWIGAKGGFALARRYGPKIHLDERKLKVGRYVLDRQGEKVVFLGRFVSVLRTYVAFLAGTLHMQWLKFFVASVAGALVWSGIYTAVSYRAASTIKRLSGALDLAIGLAAVVIVVAVFLLVRQQVAKLGDKAEAAYPGPLL